MADEVEMTPVSPAEMTPVEPVEIPPVTASEPPKTNPLARPTATLKPGLRLPPKPGAAPAQLKPGLKLPTQNALKPGLKLPTQPALKPGVKLPPKPGTATAQLKPGLKLPTQNALKPGLKLPTQTAIRPGVKLPPKPVIRKPGATVAAAPLPKPVTPQKPVEAAAPAAAPAAPEPVKAAAPEPPKPAPAPVKVVDSQGVAKLPTVSAPALPRDNDVPAAPAAAAEPSKPLEALKSVTQKLKGITQEIPAQAILHKTGIIADADMSESQKEAAKHKTARISLSDAMGVAPVKSENAPIKTIRIKRPVGLGGVSKPLPKPVSPPPAAPKAEEAPATSEAEAPAEGAETAATVAAPPAQPPARKTLKISRPGGAVRPTKFGIKRPGTVASPAKAAAPAADGDAEKKTAEGEGAVADLAQVADIPDISPLAPAPAKGAPAASDGPAWLWTLSSLVQAAACVAIGALAWLLYQNTQTMYF